MNTPVAKTGALVALYWAVLIGVGVAFDGAWPDGPALWENFATVALIVTFLAAKSLLMAFRMRAWGALGASLVAVNAAFAVVYTFSLSITLWPSLRTLVWWESPEFDVPLVGWHAGPHAFLLVDPLRWGLIGVCVWALYELVVVEEVPGPDPWTLLDAANARIEELQGENAILRGRLNSGY